MEKIEQARIILEKIGMPKKQQSDLCCLVLLSLAGIGIYDKWKDVTNEWLRIHEIIQFIKKRYDTYYAENSRETIRKQALHYFRRVALIEDNGKATNSPNYRYRLTEESVQLLQTVGSVTWQEKLSTYLEVHETLVHIYASKKKRKKMPIKINSVSYQFSTGKHNELQKAVIEEFAPRFAAKAECLYVGDTINKDLVKNKERLKKLGFEITLHDKMPDVVLYVEDKNWIFFIEAVTSVGPMSPKRVDELKIMTQDVPCGFIFVTAFLDMKTYKRFAGQIAWDTEVWIAEMPDHMIHLNGDRFIGPRE